MKADVNTAHGADDWSALITELSTKSESTTFTMTMPKDMHREISAIAESKGISKAALIRNVWRAARKAGVV